MNKEYLNIVRQGTCYPVFRGFVLIATIVLYICSLAMAAFGFLSGDVRVVASFIVASIILALISKAGQELSLMAADMADVTIDAASKKSRASEAPSVPIARNAIDAFLINTAIK